MELKDVWFSYDEEDLHAIGNGGSRRASDQTQPICHKSVSERTQQERSVSERTQQERHESREGPNGGGLGGKFPGPF